MAASGVVIEKLLRDVIPEDVAIQKETLDWVNDCATVFLQLVGAKANEIAESGAKKENYRISPDHILQALESLDKREYVEHVREQQGSQTEQSQKKRQRVGARKADAASHEELLAAQNALFKQASLKASKEGW
ncbi:Transcription corepressor [Globisporangium polare]